ncbi:SDR family NAD(P)-dependent oxidoreductase [Pseudomonas veronii]|uniref:SDR family NAD(P)-dependent oxidoreductase n=1 Tax=Pseudomonas veronii TaxID=76761 RepID=UPI0021BF46CA|nr:SDR family oxidoreductase [Pseudomonas veronii]MCT9827734.1 SDR family oxidoreductase [Pseudomonas veronii]
MSFEHSVCIVTGATSGIGRAVAEELASRGALLVLVGRDLSKGQSLVTALAARGTESIFVAVDLADRKAPALIQMQALERFGRIDVLVNNAGLLINGTALECTDADWDRVLDINLSAAFRLSREILPTFLKQGAGSIVNVASDWALMGAKGATAYCVSKAALAQLTRCMALDYSTQGIRVNAVCPSDTDTPMLDLAYEGDDREWKIQTLAASIPMARVARVEEVAKVVVFVASSDASFMTGALIPVDGGTSAQ